MTITDTSLFPPDPPDTAILARRSGPDPAAHESADTTMQVDTAAVRAAVDAQQPEQPDMTFTADWHASEVLALQLTIEAQERRKERDDTIIDRLLNNLAAAQTQVEDLLLVNRLLNEECARWQRRCERLAASIARGNSKLTPTEPGTA